MIQVLYKNLQLQQGAGGVPAGWQPASLAMSTAASVCPGRKSTPSSLALQKCLSCQPLPHQTSGHLCCTCLLVVVYHGISREPGCSAESKPHMFRLLALSLPSNDPTVPSKGGSLHLHKGQDVARLAEVRGLGLRVGQHLDGETPICGRNAGRHAHPATGKHRSAVATLVNLPRRCCG